MEMDFTSNSTGPVTTTAKFDVWNTNESKFSNSTRCITCWDQLLLVNYDDPNDFVVGMLQTQSAKARIDGVESLQCDGDVNGLMDVMSQAAALEGVVAHFLMMEEGYAAGGKWLVGMGKQDGQILYTPLNQPILENADDEDEDGDANHPTRPSRPPTDVDGLRDLIRHGSWGVPPGKQREINIP